LETTTLCEQITDRQIAIHAQPEARVADIALYVTDHRRITGLCGWQPSRDAEQTLVDIYEWIANNEDLVRATLRP
jgi:UDP-glucose 4-epimerase